MNTYMNLILEQRFFRLLSEYSQRKVSASEFTEAIEELATHVADFGINEQDYSILLRYFSFGLHRLKYNPQIEMFARFKTKSSFHKTKRII